MPFPAKTDRQAILSAAVEQISVEGLRGLSLRGLAAKLGLAPNALYRYFADRATLECALTAQSSLELLRALRAAAADHEPETAVRQMARAYVAFAREHKSLYEMLLLPCAGSGEDAGAHLRLWDFVVGQVSLLTGPTEAREAALALWAFLQGFAALEAAQVFGEGKPMSSFEFGMDAWVAATWRKAGVDQRTP